MPVVQQAWTDFTQGTLLPTGSSTDLALSTPGFFVVDGPNGPLYTRNGHFRLSTNGTLETQDGYKVKGIDGNPIKVTPGRDFHVSPTGQVQQDGATLSQVAVVNAANPNANERVGAGYFRFPADAKVQPAANAQIAEGKIESSNTVPAYTAVKLVSVMRSFEMLQRAVNLASEMTKKSVEEVARVAS
jgi:flagellar basal body rod protein FlgG